MIKKHGGIFGRNPTFNNVTVDGTLAINGPITIGGDVFSGLDYDGTWNASTNTPTLTSSVGTIGHFYIVSVAGSTDLDGITNWGVGDWAVFNGSIWQRVEGGADGNFAELSVTGTAQFADGLAASPSITNIGDTNTGLYFPSADAIAIVTGGVNRLRVTSAGDIGIGTTSPASKLDVNGTVTATGATVTGNTYLATTSGNVGIGTSGPSTKLDIVGGYVRVNEDGASTKIIQIRSDWAGVDPAINVQTNNSLLFNTNGTERMRITSAGDVGIGTSTPAVKLDVANGFIISGASSANPGVGGNIRFRDDTGTPRWLNGLLGSAAATSYSIYDFVAGAERLSINSSGDVGIGTSSPAAKLDVSGSFRAYQSVAAGYSTSTFENTNATGYVQQYFNVSAGGASGRATISYAPGIFFAIGPTDNDTTTPIVFRNNNGTERMRIDASGNVGIGTSSPAYKLDVSGTVNANSSLLIGGSYGVLYGDSGNSLIIGADNGNTGSSTRLQFNVDGTERMRITSAGDVGIGGTSFGSGALVMFIANATTAPTTNPTGGGILYVEGGALKYRGSSGTVTTIANA